MNSFQGAHAFSSRHMALQGEWDIFRGGRGPSGPSALWGAACPLPRRPRAERGHRLVPPGSLPGVLQQVFKFWFCCFASKLCKGALEPELRPLRRSPVAPNGVHLRDRGCGPASRPSVDRKPTSLQPHSPQKSLGSPTPAFPFRASLPFSVPLGVSPPLSRFFSEMAPSFRVECSLQNLIVHSLDSHPCYLCRALP